MATAEEVLNALPRLEEQVAQVDPRGRVYIRHDEEGFYFLVQLRAATQEAMAGLPVEISGVRIGAELIQDFVTHVKQPGKVPWINTKFGDKHLLAAALFEPIYVLRAADSLTDAAIEAWIAKAREAKIPEMKIKRAEQCYAAIKEYQPRGLPS
jgi:hypothetical protein